jgi:hypothetical protein
MATTLARYFRRDRFSYTPLPSNKVHPEASSGWAVNPSEIEPTDGRKWYIRQLYRCACVTGSVILILVLTLAYREM